VCGICGKLNPNYLCKKCEIILKKEKSSFVDNYQKDTTKYFNEHMYIFKYEGLIRNRILNYKFRDKSYLYMTFANFLLKDEKVFDFLKRYDIIIPVPISYQRYKQRGYNQSLLLAKEISKNVGLKLMPNVLKKSKNTVAQSTLNREERIANIENVYSINKKQLDKIENKKVLILDDIYTTGSTVNECSKMLKNANTKDIGVITIAKD
jgi:ComF family protein